MPNLKHQTTLDWLRENDEARLRELWQRADAIRRAVVGDEVHLRGLIEFSNICRRRCGYCGLNVDNAEVQRYRMRAEEILQCAHQAVRFGYGTVVLQCGEDPSLDPDWLAEVIRRIKQETPLAITLSVGEYPAEILDQWHTAGADRYLLRFETSDQALYSKIHPAIPGEKSERIAQLRLMREIGYEIGSGVMIGIPGQTYEILALDIEMFGELDLDMIGVGPFIPHGATDLGSPSRSSTKNNSQAPNTELMTYKTVALARILCPAANIPSTTALATLNKDSGRETGLARGANVVMPNLTPAKYRAKYEIYPAKACINETAAACHGCMKNRIRSLGRSIAEGPGASVNYIKRTQPPSGKPVA